MGEIEDRLRTLILEEVRPDRSPDELSDDYPLIRGGVADSLGLYHILVLLEDEFGVRVADEDVTTENFSSIASIAQLVERTKQGAAHPPAQ